MARTKLQNPGSAGAVPVLDEPPLKPRHGACLFSGDEWSLANGMTEKRGPLDSNATPPKLRLNRRRSGPAWAKWGERVFTALSPLFCAGFSE